MSERVTISMEASGELKEAARVSLFAAGVAVGTSSQVAELWGMAGGHDARIENLERLAATQAGVDALPWRVGK